jgi:hypothetical protein
MVTILAIAVAQSAMSVSAGTESTLDFLPDGTMKNVENNGAD